MSSGRTGWGIFLAFVGFYLLTGSREELWGDAKAVNKVAWNLVTEKRLDIGYAWPMEAMPGRGGYLYSPYPALVSMVQLPGTLVQSAVWKTSSQAAAFARPLTGHFASALAGGLCCVLFFGLCRQLGISALASSVTTIILGTATMLWPYARDPLSESLQTACFTGFLGALLGCAASPARGRALLLGMWAGLLINTKMIYAASLVAGAIFLAVSLRGRPRGLATVAGWAALAFAPFVALFLAYSYARWGSFLEPAALESNQSLFREHVLVGLWGLFLSTGKSVFLYSPPLLLALVGIPRLWREQRAAAVAILVCAAPVVLVTSRYLFWDGAHAWGPRYLLFLHPAALLPLALLLDGRLQAGWRAHQKVVYGAILAAGLAVQILGNAFWRGHFIAISRAVNAQWIGSLGARGSQNYEDLYGVQYLPHHQPILGHWWLFENRLLGRSYEEALPSAPWARYTDLAIDVKATYDGARADWWALLWMRDYPRLWPVGLALTAADLALLAAGVWLWKPKHERRKPRRDPEKR